MGDFYQNGIVTTLHDLSNRSLDELEYELICFSKVRPMSLLLPSLFSEIQGEALPNIVKHLKEVPYLGQIVIGLDSANREEYQQAVKFFGELPQHHRILWNDGPRLQAIDQELQELGLAPQELGKGRNVWYSLGYIFATGKSEAIALHDCDILTYNRRMLARLIYPVANPNFNYEFCKGFYARVAGQNMNGRVCRLLVTPLLRALKRVTGRSSYLDYMDSYRYPLAGELSLRRDVISDIRIASDWGLEISMLSEVHRNYSNNRICQVDIAETYDHKHQELSLDNKKAGLSKMSIDINKALFRKLATQGIIFTPEIFLTIKATYFRIALDFVETYKNDARINGLNLDVHKEEMAIEMFADNIMEAGQEFLDEPMKNPFIPSWNRVVSAMPNIYQRLLDAVEQDYQQFQ